MIKTEEKFFLPIFSFHLIEIFLLLIYYCYYFPIRFIRLRYGTDTYQFIHSILNQLLWREKENERKWKWERKKMKMRKKMRENEWKRSVSFTVHWIPFHYFIPLFHSLSHTNCHSLVVKVTSINSHWLIHAPISSFYTWLFSFSVLFLHLSLSLLFLHSLPFLHPFFLSPWKWKWSLMATRSIANEQIKKMLLVIYCIGLLACYHHFLSINTMRIWGMRNEFNERRNI